MTPRSSTCNCSSDKYRICSKQPVYYGIEFFILFFEGVMDDGLNRRESDAFDGSYRDVRLRVPMRSPSIRCFDAIRESGWSALRRRETH